MNHVTFTEAEREAGRKILEFYANDPKRWTQGTCCRNAAGESAGESIGESAGESAGESIGSTVARGDFTPVCWCPFGVAMDLNINESTLFNAFRKAKNSPSFIYTRWNDEPTRTFFEVRDLLESIANGAIANGALE